MKRGLTSEQRISRMNVAQLGGITNDSPEAATMLAFTGMIAEVCDAIAAGDNIYITIGANRARTALVCTLNDGDRKTFAAGSDIFEMFEKAVEAF